MSEIQKKECPDCGAIMGFDMDEALYYCLDNNCGYTETCEDGKGVNDEEVVDDNDSEFHCPHCNHVIDKDDLPVSV